MRYFLAIFGLAVFLAAPTSSCSSKSDLSASFLGPNVCPVKLIHVTDTELREFGKTLWDSDVNRIPNVVFDIQGKTTSGSTSDNAPNSLFQSTPHQLNTIPTFVTLKALQNNFNTNTAAEIDHFLDEVMKTKVMQTAFELLALTGIVPYDYTAFRAKVRDLWFTTYVFQGGRSSSGFQHVFVGEVKNGNEPVGFHNWMRFLYLEKAGNVNYLGRLNSMMLGDASAINLRFTYNGKHKHPSSSFFIGTSPEFDMAIFTVCFLVRRERPCEVELAGEVVNIRTRIQHYHGKTYIRTAYPEL